MSVLLLGRWDHAGNLVIEDSHLVADGDQKTIDSLVTAQDNTDHMAWACEFLVDEHRAAVQLAYEEYVADAGTRLIDDAHGVEPTEQAADPVRSSDLRSRNDVPDAQTCEEAHRDAIRVAQHETNAVNARIRLHQLLHGAGVLPYDADVLIGAIEAGAVAGAHCTVIELGGTAPRDRDGDFGKGWDEGIAAACRQLVHIADHTLRLQRGGAAAARMLLAHLAGAPEPSTSPQALEALPHREVLGRPGQREFHPLDTQVEWCELCGGGGFLARAWEDERLPALCIGCHEKSGTSQAAALYPCEAWCGLAEEHMGLCAPAPHRHCPHAATHRPSQGPGARPSLCLHNEPSSRHS